MKFTELFCKDQEFIERFKHKNKYKLVLLEINKEELYSDRISFFVTDNITVSCNIL